MVFFNFASFHFAKQSELKLKGKQLLRFFCFTSFVLLRKTKDIKQKK